MRLWLMTIGEPLPIDGPNERLLRTGILAKRAAQTGHHVTWWTSSFDHTRKRQRQQGDKFQAFDADCQLRLLKCKGYRHNVSPQRVRHHQGIAARFREAAPHETPPDVILCSWPIVELCAEAIRYGQERGIPVVLDIRDMWPDAIADVAPRVLRPLAQVVLRKQYRAARKAIGAASAITGITEPIVDWALQIADRPRSASDRAFSMGYQQAGVNSDDEAKAMEFWRSQGISPSASSFVVCFFGTIGRHFEIGPVVQAARQLQNSHRNITFVMCGDGPHLKRWRSLATGVSNIVLPGWVNAAQIQALMRLSSAGLAPYHSSWDFRISIPNKPIEYMSAGLPVVSSLDGVLANLLDEHGCGINYANGSSGDLVRVLTDCYDHPLKRARMAKNAAKLFRQRFSADSVYPEMLHYLEELSTSPSLVAA